MYRVLTKQNVVVKMIFIYVLRNIFLEYSSNRKMESTIN